MENLIRTTKLDPRERGNTNVFVNKMINNMEYIIDNRDTKWNMIEKVMNRDYIPARLIRMSM